MSVNQNKIQDILHKVKDISGKHLNKVHLVYGEYDLIAEIQAHNPETSVNILRMIKETEGVNTLKTYVVSDQLTDEAVLTLPPEPC
ncbi:MAG TPA: Lrp/AsnC ligand binding domain-containing protein [Candidatus Nanoarchaeia archaeon]|nr:Lrp/AsnC ligand binding domain-containing protein [Candidatus Nanoarchaeia archaeon]